jgi:hypothetical protein
LIYIDSGAPGHAVNVDILPRLEALARRIGSERLIALADQLRFIESTFKSYVNPLMLTDSFALAANSALEKIE